MNTFDQDKYRAIAERGHIPIELENRLPWWVLPRNILHTISIEPARMSQMYSRHTSNGYEYAYVEWRAGSAYLFGLYLDGRNITPFDQQVITKNELRIKELQKPRRTSQRYVRPDKQPV